MHPVFATLLLFAISSSSAATKPNILIILADDMGYSDLGCYGGEIATSEGQLILTSTGTDPGLTFDTSDVQTPGPYTLAFRVQSHSSGEGEVYWTHDAETSLPKGQHQVFPVTHDGQWHDVSIKLDDAKMIHALRLDPCSGAGEVCIEGLRLNDASGKTLKQWP